MINPLPVVVADIRRSRGAVAAVVALIAVAVALGVAVSCQERALRVGSADAAGAFDLVIGAKGSPTQLVLTTVYLQPALLDLMPGGALESLAADPSVAYAAPLVFGDSYRGFPVVGSTADFVTRGAQLMRPRDASSVPIARWSWGLTCHSHSAPASRRPTGGPPRRAFSAMLASTRAFSTPWWAACRASAVPGTAPSWPRWRPCGRFTRARAGIRPGQR